MVATSDIESIRVRAGAVILASASLCPADPDLVWAPLGGRPLLAWAISACLAFATLDPIVVVVAPGHALQANELMAALAGPAVTPGKLTPHWGVLAPVARHLTSGAPAHGASADGDATGFDEQPANATPTGERRRDATLAGVKALVSLAPDCAWVVVHEATRPLASAALIRAGLNAAMRADAGAIAAEPVKETLKRAPDGVGGLVAETLPRAQLARAQTPQVYRVAALLVALRQLPPTADPADEATIAAAAGMPLVTFPGGHDNLRATTRADLPIIAAALRQRQSTPGA